MAGPVRPLLAPLVAWALSLSVARSLGIALDGWGVVACIAGVHAAYRFDELVDAFGFRRLPVAWRDPRWREIGIAAALMGGAVLASPRLLLPLALLSCAALSYVPLKRVVPKNLLTAGAWTGAVFGLSLSAFALTGQSLLAGLALFSLVVSNANLCDLSDVQADRENRVLGFTTLVGPRAAARIAGTVGLVAAAAAALAGALALCLPGIGYAIAGWFFADVLAARRSMRIGVDAALVLTGPLSLLLTR